MAIYTFTNNETKETTEIDVINDITVDLIIAYCKQNNQVSWLKEIVKTEVPVDKNGKERKYSFMELRRDFTKKFMPDIAPSESSKKHSFYDIIDAL